MTEAEIFEIIRSAMWTAVLVGTPILVAALIIGFVIGLVQALTSIQELTLTFIPKVIAVVAVFFLTIGYMTQLCL
ncbi:MAG: flagellar biosynthetic protein FliQ, partial [Pseudomonadota bacterium]